MKNKTSPKSRDENLIVQDLGNETLIYDLLDNRAFCLNETMTLVWQECNGKTSITEIAQNVSKKLNDTVTKDFVWLALDRLNEEKLLESEGADAIELAGLTRREAIRKVGMASMVALPVISAIVSPTSAHAASACSDIPSGQACTSTADICCPNDIGQPSQCVNVTGDPDDPIFFCVTSF